MQIRVGTIGREQHLNKDRFGQTWYRVATANSSESLFQRDLSVCSSASHLASLVNCGLPTAIQGQRYVWGAKADDRLRLGVRLLTHEVVPNHNGSLVVGQE
jgi:hypothetical protein